MIVCKKCGTQNADKDSFCVSCGTYLEWSGERVVEQPEPPAAPPPPPPPPSFVDRVKQAVGMEEAETATAPPPPPPPPSAPGQGAWIPPANVSSPPPPPSQAPPAASPPVAPPPAARGTYETPETQAPLLPTPGQPPAAPAPVLPQQPPPRQPQAVAPGPERPRPAPRIEAPATPRLVPGDLICGQCGTGNNPSRHFCQRCGASLAQAVTVKTPWWRRLFPAREAPTAGTRHRVESQSTGAGVGSAFRTGALALVGLVVAGAVLGYAAVPSLRSTVNTRVSSAVHDFERPFCVGSFVPERPADVTTSAALPGHPAANLVDLINSDYWAAPAIPQPVITIKFAQATDVDFVLVTTGAASDYANLARPKDIRIIYGSGAQEEMQLKDDPKATCYGLHGRHEKSAAIRVLSIYPSPQSSAVAIAELEFFRFG
jgi:hypothetical protein